MAKRIFRVGALVFGLASLYFWWRLFDAARRVNDPNVPIIDKPVYEGWIWQALTYAIICLVFALGCLLTSRQTTKVDMVAFLAVWGAALVVAVLGSLLFPIPLWMSAAIVTAAWFVNGAIAAVEGRSLWGRARSNRKDDH